MIPTAEELLANNIDGLREALQDDDLYYFYRGVICEFAKGFAEMHVAEAMESIWENYKGSIDEYKEEFLNTYPLELIK